MRARIHKLGLAAGLAIFAPAAFGFIGDPTILIDRALNSSDLTIRYEGASVALVELRVNGRSLASRPVDARSRTGETNFSVDPAVLAEGENEVEVVLYDAAGTRVGSRKIVVTLSRQPESSVYIDGLRSGSTVMGPVEIRVGMRREFREAYVSFLINGEWKSMRNFPPYSYLWDTTRYPNGWHTVEAWVVDRSMQTHKSPPVRVFVNNPGGRTDRRSEPGAPPVEPPAQPPVEPPAQPPVEPPAKDAEPPAPAAGHPASSAIVGHTGPASGFKPVTVGGPIETGVKSLAPTGARVVERSGRLSSREAEPASGSAGPKELSEAGPDARSARTRAEAVEPALAERREPAPARETEPVLARSTTIALTTGVRLSDVTTFSVVYEGRPVRFDVAPRVTAGIPVAPFRHLFEQAGGQVGWKHLTKEVFATGLGREIWFRVGDDRARVDGLPVQLELAPFIERGRVLVPLTFIDSALDVAVEYDPQSGHVLIRKRS